MNDTDRVTAEILALAPGYAKSLASLREEWRPDEPGLCMRLGALVWWMTQEIGEGREDFGRLPEYLDSLLDCGSQELRDVVASCYVESLVNRVPELLPRRILEALLGPNSRSVAESWGRF
jgi:hypothetical protein